MTVVPSQKSVSVTAGTAIAGGVAAQLGDDVLVALLPGISGLPWLLSIPIALAATFLTASMLARMNRELAMKIGIVVGGASAVSGLVFGDGGLFIALITMVVGVVGGMAVARNT